MEGQQKHSNFWPRYLNDPILKIYFLHLFVQKLATNSHHFLAGKNNKIDSKMTKMPLPEMHCTSNSLSHKLITRSLDPPAVDLGDSVGIHVNVAFNKKLRRQITPPNNHKVYIETPFSRKEKINANVTWAILERSSFNQHVPEFFEINLLSFSNIMHSIQRL